MPEPEPPVPPVPPVPSAGGVEPSPSPDGSRIGRRPPWLPPGEASVGGAKTIGTTIGTIVAVVLVVAGLALIGLVVFLVVALNNLGSNK